MTNYTARTAAETWRLAQALFPTDYLYDKKSSDRAGYPIYKSTAEGNDSWISDLSTRLELNIYHGTEIETITIWVGDLIENKHSEYVPTVSERDILKFVEKKLEAYHNLGKKDIPERMLQTFADALMAYNEMAEALTGKRVMI